MNNLKQIAEAHAKQMETLSALVGFPTMEQENQEERDGMDADNHDCKLSEEDGCDNPIHENHD